MAAEREKEKYGTTIPDGRCKRERTYMCMLGLKREEGGCGIIGQTEQQQHYPSLK